MTTIIRRITTLSAAAALAVSALAGALGHGSPGFGSGRRNVGAVPLRLGSR